MPTISLTTFLDFVVTSGTPRLTVVRNAKVQYARGYQPKFDFYKQLREAIIAAHGTSQPTQYLKRFVSTLKDKHKVEYYSTCVNGYTKWLGKKACSWVEPKNTQWQSEDLVVKINPELGLNINGENYLVKLYFKQDSPSKLRVDTILHLMASTYTSGPQPPVTSVLDVPNGKLITTSGRHVCIPSHRIRPVRGWD